MFWVIGEFGVVASIMRGSAELHSVTSIILLYVDDIPEVISDGMVIFADDTTTVTCAGDCTEVTSTLENNLALLQNWFM